MSHDVDALVARVFRDEWGRIVATLIRVFGDWDLAEECAQDALERALLRWPRDGLPDNPGAWLTTVARRRALDRLRRSKSESDKYGEIAVSTLGPSDDIQDSGISDDRLRLLFTCCHPALSLESQVSLTLRTLAGLTTAEIARAFIVPESTMAKRLVRSKAKIRHAGIPYRVPPGYLLPERTVAVLGVIYLLFNEGYSASSGSDLVRGDLCVEAVALGRLLVELMPDEPEARGLLALMLLQDSRRGARVDIDGTLIPLDEQDRWRWDAAAISDGLEVLESALRQRRSGPYQIQAAIAACHCVAVNASDTDWREIAQLYEKLYEINPSPVVELNRAVAIAMSDGPEKGLELVERLESSHQLDRYHLLSATRAELLRRLDRPAEAAIAYEQALELTNNLAERQYLQRRYDQVTSSLA